MDSLHKYPRTHHVEGSRLQPGDEDLQAVPFRELREKHLVVEEKLDGANSGISFDARGRLLLQSRGHFLRGGASERQFDVLKAWANAHAQAFRDVLGDRYVVYGEWLYAKHTIFYDALPHYFLEFDVLDLEAGGFLSTARRRELLRGLPIASVPVLHEGDLRQLDELTALVGRSHYKTRTWRENLTTISQGAERVARETDASDTMEGLYIKVEQDGRVVGRFKFIRASFLTTVLDSGSHWQDRPLLANQLAPGVDLFRPAGGAS
jgi:hypothetical protein